MIGHHTRLRENDDLPPWRGPAVKKSRHFLMRARWSRVKLCAVGMRNAILGNDLKSPTVALSCYRLRNVKKVTTHSKCPFRRL